jgi:hypothetical protein
MEGISPPVFLHSLSENTFKSIGVDQIHSAMLYLSQHKKIEAAMQMSRKWSRQALKLLKGNHRRVPIRARIAYGLPGNTLWTPTSVEALMVFSILLKSIGVLRDTFFYEI